MEMKKMPENACFTCSLCNFKCSKKSNYATHLKTKKHAHRLAGNNLETMEIAKNAVCSCDCGKEFKTNAGLWKHKQHCDGKKYKTEPSDKQVIMLLLKQNSEIMKDNSDLRREQSDLKDIILEIVKNGTQNTTNHSNNTTTNSHNKAFNLQFFLNETCKNAMNITDFVDSIKLQLSDFMSMGELGFVEGISNIIVKNLNSLDETVRPIHCTDQKRETFYVKDENKWEKEERR